MVLWSLYVASHTCTPCSLRSNFFSVYTKWEIILLLNQNSLFCVTQYSVLHQNTVLRVAQCLVWNQNTSFRVAQCLVLNQNTSFCVAQCLVLVQNRIYFPTLHATTSCCVMNKAYKCATQLKFNRYSIAWFPKKNNPELLRGYFYFETEILLFILVFFFFKFCFNFSKCTQIAQCCFFNF